MNVKELIEILKDCDGDSKIRIVIEKGRGIVGSEEFEVEISEYGIYFNGVEDFNDDEDFDEEQFDFYVSLWYIDDVI